MVNRSMERWRMRIGVPDLITNSYFPALAAVELGLFREEGLDASLEHVFPIPRTLEQLRNGDLDLVAGPAHAVLAAFPEWEGAKLVAALAQGTYWLLVLRSGLNVTPGDVQAVKGLRIGAAPGPDLAFRQLLADAGIDAERDEVAIGPVPGATGAGVSFGVHAARCLADGVIDGFWANGMGTEVAVRSGAGVVVLDVRRGLGPEAARHYTFPALVATDGRIADDPAGVAAAVRAVVRAQRALREDPSLAAQAAGRLFPQEEAALITGIVEQDLPFYQAGITREAVAGVNEFARKTGLLAGRTSQDQAHDHAYERAIAVQFSGFWEP